MLTLQIDKDESSTNDTIDYLHHVAEKIKSGFTSGEGWSLEGEESEDDEQIYGPK